MENAVNAIGKIFPKAPAAEQLKDEVLTKDNSKSDMLPSEGDDKNTTVDVKVDKPVEHTHVKKQHETREQKVVDKEIHQDHYHTTVQPLKDTEVLPEKHDYVQEEKERSINRDDGAAKAKAEADRAQFANTIDEQTSESHSKEPTKVDQHVHHHVHETVVPVVEKGKFSQTLTMMESSNFVAVQRLLSRQLHIRRLM
jgi:hypothetical protein